MRYRAGHVTIYVSDMERAVAFYRDALGMSGVRTSPEYPDYVELPTEGATVALMRPAEHGQQSEGLVGRCTGITLMVADLKSVYQTLLEREVRFSRPPTQEPWGGLTTTFFDPDGNEIALLDEESLRKAMGG